MSMTDENFLDYLKGRGQGFNKFGAGNKQYGTAGAPNTGPVGDKSGYQQRDSEAKSMRNALLRRMKARQNKNYMSSDNLSPMRSTYRGLM